VQIVCKEEVDLSINQDAGKAGRTRNAIVFLGVMCSPY